MADQKSMKSFLGPNPTAVPEKPSAVPANTQSATEAKAVAPPISPPGADASLPTVPPSTSPSVETDRFVTIRLRDLPDPATQEDEFANRFADKYAEANLGEDMLESIRLSGLKVKPTVVAGSKGWEIVGGHRRIACLYVLARRNAAGFSLDMPVVCEELVNATRQQLVMQSIISNSELAEKLDPKERLLAVKKGIDAGASIKELAANFRVTTKSIERDLTITENPRVLAHVLADRIPPTTAGAICPIAKKQGRLDEWLDHFDSWAKKTQDEIDEEDARSKKEKGKGLPPTKAKVMSRLDSAIVRGWMDALAKGKPLVEEKDLGFEAKFDRKTGVGEVRFKLNALTDDIEFVARVVSQASLVAKNLAAIAQTRHALETAEGPQAALMKSNSVLDLDFLNEFGLDDLADQLQQELGDTSRANPFAGPSKPKPLTLGRTGGDVGTS